MCPICELNLPIGEVRPSKEGKGWPTCSGCGSDITTTPIGTPMKYQGMHGDNYGGSYHAFGFLVKMHCSSCGMRMDNIDIPCGDAVPFYQLKAVKEKVELQ